MRTAKTYCDRHSAYGHGVAFCVFPHSDTSTCHECGGIMPPPGSGETIAEHLAGDTHDGEPIARFCTEICEQTWNLDHPGFWNA